MRYHRFLFFWLCLILATGTQAQVFKGRISDPEGAPIPFVRIYIENAKTGTLAREDGSFALPVPEGKSRIVIQHLGYARRVIEVEMPGAEFSLITLEPEGITMQAVEITGGKKDPAYEIMEQLIAHKQENLKETGSFIRQTYSKIRLEKDTLPGKQSNTTVTTTASSDQVSMEIGARKKKKTAADTLATDTVKEVWPRLVAVVESRYAGFFQAPGQYKTVIDAYKKTSEEDKPSSGLSAEFGPRMEMDISHPYLFNPDPTQVTLNFYKNLIQATSLGDRPWVSPLHSELWRVTYTYRLEEKALIDGQVHYKIAITPRNNQSPSFEGYIWVIDKQWVIKEAEFEIMPSTLSFFRKFRLHHWYARGENGAWLIEKESYDYEAREGRELYRGSTTAIHSDYQLEVTHPKNFFSSELVRATEQAFERDSSYWAEIRPVKLELQEQSFLRAQDSIRTYLTSTEYLAEQDSIYNHLSLKDIVLTGIGFRDRKRKMQYYFSPLLSQMQWFGVGGYRHALSFDVDKFLDRGKILHMGSNLDFGFVNKDLKGELRVGLTYNPRRFARWHLRAGDIYGMVNPNETITAIISRGNFISKKYIGGGHRFEVVNGLYFDFGFEFADRSSIDQLQLEQWTKDLFGENNVPLEFDPYREMLFDFRLQFTPFQKYQTMPHRKVLLGSKWPTFELKYKKGVAGIFGSEINFDFIQIKAEQEFRPGTLGIGRWSLAAGTFLQANNLRFNDYTFFRGSDPFLFVNPLQNFQLLGRTLSTPNEYVRGHYLHDFGRILTNKIPLVRRTQLEMAAGAGILYVRDSDFYHAEVFGGLQYPFRIKRQRFRVGAYFATSYGTYPKALNAEFKVGMNFYNPIKRMWEY